MCVRVRVCMYGGVITICSVQGIYDTFVGRSGGTVPVLFPNKAQNVFYNSLIISLLMYYEDRPHVPHYSPSK